MVSDRVEVGDFRRVLGDQFEESDKKCDIQRILTSDGT